VLPTATGDRGLDTLWEGYKAFFSHIDRPMRMMGEELRAGRPPAKVMLRLALGEEEVQRQLFRLPRSAPCPCGSLRKIKHCCGRPGKRSGQVQSWLVARRVRWS